MSFSRTVEHRRRNGTPVAQLLAELDDHRRRRVRGISSSSP
jgi:hypothetical protein